MGFPKFIFNRMALRQCLGAVTSIACVSEATRGQLQKHLPAFFKKAIRIYNCIEPQPQCSDTYRIEKWRNDPFLLCVAQHRKNKNLGLLIRTVKRLLTGSRVSTNTKLMIVGISGPETRRISNLISQLGLSDCVYLEEGLSEGELQWCYRQCEVLVSPSITEGFGLPVAEGLLAGCRVICSDIAAHWEVGAGRCRFVDLRQYGEQKLADAIVASLAEPKPRRADLPELLAKNVARQYVALYGGLLSASTAPSASAHMELAGSERQVL